MAPAACRKVSFSAIIYNFKLRFAKHTVSCKYRAFLQDSKAKLVCRKCYITWKAIQYSRSKSVIHFHGVKEIRKYDFFFYSLCEMRHNSEVGLVSINCQTDIVLIQFSGSALKDVRVYGLLAQILTL